MMILCGIARATLVTFLSGSNANLDIMKALAIPLYYISVLRAVRLGDAWNALRMMIRNGEL
eukprot:90280-Pyramimonas_sp.AAC.1